MPNKIMFLDTIQLVIELSERPESYRHPFSDKSSWKKTEYSWQQEYTLNKRTFQKMQRDGVEYLPFIKYRKRLGAHELIAEFSVPKLFHGHNFLPVLSDDTTEVLEKLLDTIHGVYGFKSITMDDLERATLSRMDCSIAIPFDSRVDLEKALKMIKDSKLDARLSVDNPAYSATSHGISIQCNQWQFCFYNKTLEYKDSIKPIIDNAYSDESTTKTGNIIQGGESPTFVSKGRLKYEPKGDVIILPSFIRECHAAGKEFLQCELRLDTKDKIKRAMTRARIEPRDLTLRQAVEGKIPMTILQRHWQSVVSGMQRTDIATNDLRIILESLLMEDLKPETKLTLAGVVSLAKEVEMQKLRDIYVDKHGRSGWQRFLEKIKSVPEIHCASDSPVFPITKAIMGTGHLTRSLWQPKHIHRPPSCLCITLTYCTRFLSSPPSPYVFPSCSPPSKSRAPPTSHVYKSHLTTYNSSCTISVN